MAAKPHSYTNSMGGISTPEVISASAGTDIFSTDFIIQSSNANTVTIFVGGSSGQKHELEPGESIHLTDLFHGQNEEVYSSEDIFVQSTLAGEDYNVLYTERV